MIQTQYKQSEIQESLRGELTDSDLLAFAAFNKVSQFGNTHELCFCDWDVNCREQRQFYINKRHKRSRKKGEEEHEQSIQSSMVTQLSSKRSVKSKVQSGKRSDLPMVQTPQPHLISKIKDENSGEIKEKDENLAEAFQYKLPMHSKFSHEFQLGTPSEPSKPLKDGKPIYQEEISEIPNQKSSQQIQIAILPLIQKQSRKIQYYGSPSPQITTLNEFMVKPLTYEFESRNIRSKIDEYALNNSQKSKIEYSQASSPMSRLKQSKKEQKPSNLEEFMIPAKQYKKVAKSLLVPQMKNRYTESALINTEGSQKEKTSEVSVDKSKSKSKSKIKKVKDSTLFKRKAKFNHSPCFGKPKIDKSQSPELPHEPITHMEQRQLKNSHKKSNSPISHSNNSSAPIPVEDYDNDFDKQLRQREDFEFNTSEVDQNIDISKPYGGQEKGSRVAQSNNLLAYYDIPIYPIVKPRPQGQQYPSGKKIAKDEPISANQSESRKQEKPQKSTRRKIFSHLDKEQRQEKDTNSSDFSDYTDEEMRMILAARGNKYKETIVRQYIRLQRQNQRKKGD